MDQLTSRAHAAYFKKMARLGQTAVVPANTSGVREWRGRHYVVLETADSRALPLAVYRVRVPSGELRQLSRWPNGVARTATSGQRIRTKASLTERASDL